MLVRPTEPPLEATSSPPPADAPSTAPRPKALGIQTGHHGRYTLLTMSGRLTADTVVTAEAQILTTIVLGPAPLHLALDLSRLDVVDLHGAHLLTKTHFAVRAARGTLHLIAPAHAPARGALSRYLLPHVVQHRQDLASLAPTGPSDPRSPSPLEALAGADR
ncbi:STAS domain-containing protein [Actinomadura terrae]|uniref:STAS domain-containing protein n=1 Tax=Actinomadura terrae TaxID=604353 RepID=UPI001FA80F9F|nr:STAS domain-containing protein [Actinomadura terrae]